MANKSTDPITEADLTEFIRTQDDFALELYAYSLALQMGYDAKHGGSYTDRITGKTRQFDVRAHLACSDELNVYLSIESKSLRHSFPVLVSQIPRLKAESFQDVMQAPGVRILDGGRRAYPEPRVIKLEGLDSFYVPNQYVGKALVQVGKDVKGEFIANDYEVFEKWGQAISSLNDLVREASGLQRPSQTPQRSIAVPVLLVPDGTLWVANYSENGTLQSGPKPADEVRFFIGDKQTYVPNPEYIYRVSHLHLVTKRGLKDLLASFLQGGKSYWQLIETLKGP